MTVTVPPIQVQRVLVCRPCQECHHCRVSGLTGRRFGAAFLLIAVAIGALWLGIFLSHRGIEWAARFSEIASFVLAVAGVLAAPFGKVAQWLRGPQPLTMQQIVGAESRLRATLTAAWDAEGSAVYQDQPMHVRFSSWAEVVDRQVLPDVPWPDVPAAGQPSAGDFRGVAEAFSCEPRFRRVVLGEAGAGKTVLVAELQRRLLATPASAGPVPVIVPAGDWRPDERSLLDWLADRLAADYAWLPVTHARALVAGSKVLPILDGLDEMPRALQPAAITRINEHHVYRPLIVTSREEQYVDAIRQNGEGIKDASVAAISPLLSADIRAYLDPTGRSPWTAVLAGMDANSPLAAVLANPLMLWLARIVYTDKSPDHLMFFDTRTALENHFLDQFVPAVYKTGPGWPHGREFRCTEREAERWLGTLAYRRRSRFLGDEGRRDDDRGTAALEWWRLGAAAGWWRALGIGLRAVMLSGVGAALSVWVLARQGNWRHGAYSGPLDLGDLLLGGRAGQLIRPTVEHLAHAIPKANGRYIQTGITSAFQVIDYVFARPLLFVVTAVLAALSLTMVLQPSFAWLPRRLQIRPTRVLTRALASCSLLFGMAVLTSWLTLHLPRGLSSRSTFFDARSTWVTLLVISLVGLTSIPSSFIRRSDISGNLSPRDSFRLDRQAHVVVAISKRSAIAIVVWLFCGPPVATAYGIFAITATLVMLTLGGQGRSASGSYIDARNWLAVRGRLPWRTMTFLADASRRGVLRQAGAIYQFRHVRLQDQADNWRLTRKPQLSDRWTTWKDRLREIPYLIGQKSGVNPPPWVRLNELCEEAAKFRRIARTSQNDLPPSFNEDLDELASRLISRPDDAALAARVLLDAYRTLAKANPAAYKPGLAKAMNSLASVFPRHEALRLQQDAVDEYSELTAGDPATFLPGLAQAVRRLADELTQLGLAEEACRKVNDFANECRHFAETAPDIFRPVLADSLSDLADRVWTSAPWESLALRREVVAIYRDLADESPARFGSSLASSLDTLASSLQQLEKGDEELNTVRAAIEAYRTRAEYIAALRHQIEQRTTASKTFRFLARDLAEAQPVEFLPTLARAFQDLAVEMNTAGRRLESQAFAKEALDVRMLYRYMQRHRQVAVMTGKASEGSAVGRMAALALRLWKLGKQQEALATAQACGTLAPAGRIGASPPDPWHPWLTRFIIRLRETSDMGRAREDARFWRRITRQNSAYRPPLIAETAKDLDLIEATRLLRARRLESLSDSLDTHAFRRQVARRNGDTLIATRQAVKVQQRAVSTYRRMCRRLYAESDLARSLDTLAIRLQAAGQAEAAANAALEASKIRQSLPVSPSTGRL